MELKFDEKGLIPVIVQDHYTKEVLTLAYMNAETLALTIAEKRTVFWSRSRQEIWRKGETSGNTQQVVSITADCDGDALVVEVIKKGPACHTGAESCFFNSVYLSDEVRQFSWQGLYELYGTVADQPCSLDEAATLFPGCRLTCCTSRLKHQLTHQTLYADCYLVEGYAGSLPEEGEWVPENGLDSYPMPRLMERLLETVSPAGGLGKMKKRDV